MLWFDGKSISIVPTLYCICFDINHLIFLAWDTYYWLMSVAPTNYSFSWHTNMPVLRLKKIFFFCRNLFQKLIHSSGSCSSSQLSNNDVFFRENSSFQSFLGAPPSSGRLTRNAAILKWHHESRLHILYITDDTCQTFETLIKHHTFQTLWNL